ncbi:MAG: glutathione S-transferase family protein [Deltaproteobacteria bacterium]|nr:glutathione S-transferase family protein [Deltaproteobacteria bacterium]
MYKLVIGNKNYSSWSLRAWLYLRQSAIAFEEIRISLYSETEWRNELRRYTPAGRVPVLLDGKHPVWDSQAIIEYLIEREPQAISWPADARARAVARSVSAEMHSGFLAIRDELPQNLRARRPRAMSALSAACRSQIARIDEIWTHCLRDFGDGGPWLFGPFSIADVMFAPVALRFVTYAIPVSPEAETFIRSVEGLPAVQDWGREAEAEPERLAFIDDLLPAGQTPLTPG